MNHHPRKPLLQEERPYITVVDVRDYAYCPLVPYHTLVLHIKERETEAMQYGKELHEQPPLAPVIPKLKAQKILKNIEFTSHRHKLTGKVDCIVVTRHNEYIPVEAKWSEPKHPGKPRKHHRIQLAAYALLIEEHYKTTVKRALLYYSRSQQLMEIPITSHDKQQVKEIIRKIYKMIQTEEPPKVKPNPKQCQDCGYQPYCQPKTQPRKAPYLS